MEFKHPFMIKKADKNYPQKDAFLPKARDSLESFKNVLESLRERKRNFFVPDPERVIPFIRSFSRYGYVTTSDASSQRRYGFALTESSFQPASEALKTLSSYLNFVSHKPEEFHHIVSSLTSFSPAFASAFISLYMGEENIAQVCSVANARMKETLNKIDALFKSLEGLQSYLAHALISLPLEYEFSERRPFYLIGRLPRDWSDSPYLHINLAYSSNVDEAAKIVSEFFSEVEELQEIPPREVHPGITVVEKVLYGSASENAKAAP